MNKATELFKDFPSKILYKYRTINSFTYQLLINSELYYSFPHQFNDPFDCFIKSRYEGDKNEWEKYLQKYPSNKQESILQFVKSKGFNAELINKELPEDIRTNYNTAMMVYCFSEICDSILMWAHYADIHKGICLGFNTFHFNDQDAFILMHEIISKDEIEPDRRIAPLSKVKYSKTLLEPYNGLKDSPSRISEFLQTKYKCWGYEKEWRSMLKYEYEKQNMRFNKESLVEVIFGINTNPAEEEAIKKIIDKHYGSHVILKKARHSQTEYKIEFDII